MSCYSEDGYLNTHQFYWCFFELNNKKVIAVNSTGNWNEMGLPLGWDIDLHYDLCYEFGEEFNGYFGIWSGGCFFPFMKASELID